MQSPYMEVRHFSLPYTGLTWLYMEVRHQNILQQGGNESGLQMLISFDDDDEDDSRSFVHIFPLWGNI